VIYRNRVEKGSGKSFGRFNGTILVAFEIFLQAMLLTALLRKINKNFGMVNLFLQNKIYMAITLFLLGLCVFGYYSINRIEKDLKKERYKNTMRNRLLVFVAIVFPIIIIAVLSKK
jgi:hypothetical protein